MNKPVNYRLYCQGTLVGTIDKLDVNPREGEVSASFKPAKRIPHLIKDYINFTKRSRLGPADYMEELRSYKKKLGQSPWKIENVDTQKLQAINYPTFRGENLLTWNQY
jgi:hypothetical protein